MIWKKPSAYIDRHWHAFKSAKASMSLCREIFIATDIPRKTMDTLPPKGKCNGCVAAIDREAAK